MTAPSGEVRLDVWLWAARLFKHRSTAAEACDGGHVKVDGLAGKPGRRVRLGDRIEATTPGGLRVVEVRGLSAVRGPASEATQLYEDFSPPPPPPDPWARVLREAGSGRPTGRDRRLTDRLRDR